MSDIHSIQSPYNELLEEPNAIEMKTIKTNIVPPKIPVFKIVKYTKCVKITRHTRFRTTSIVLPQGEIYWGHIIMHKNLIYVDISECYKCKMGTKNTGLSIFIPIIFDMTGKYMLNAIEYNEPMYF